MALYIEENVANGFGLFKFKYMKVASTRPIQLFIIVCRNMEMNKYFKGEPTCT